MKRSNACDSYVQLMIDHCALLDIKNFLHEDAQAYL